MNRVITVEELAGINPNYAYEPPDWSIAPIVAKARKLAQMLERCLGEQMAIEVEDGPFQDATFCGVVRPIAYDGWLIRLSKFNFLATILENRSISPDGRRKIIAALADAGFVFVPEDLVSPVGEGTDRNPLFVQLFDHI